MTETLVFACSICAEPSAEICVYCTKDACGNHRCWRCKRCSDCCECDLPMPSPEPVLAEVRVSIDGAPEIAEPLAAFTEPHPEPCSESHPEPGVEPREESDLNPDF
jgi:hypothetical protein